MICSVGGGVSESSEPVGEREPERRERERARESEKVTRDDIAKNPRKGSETSRP